MNNLLERLSLFLVGVIFAGVGIHFVKDSMEAKDLIESSLFAILGIIVGILLVLVAVFGPPG